MKKTDKKLLNHLNFEIEDYIDEYTSKNSKDVEKFPSTKMSLDLRSTLIYDEYSGQSHLNQGIFSYIDESFKLTKKSTEFEIEVSYPLDMTQEEKEKIKSLLKLHYAIEHKTVRKKIFQTKAIAAILLLIGAAIYLVFGLLEWFDKNFVFRGIIEIFSWVFIWEACNLFVFTNTENKLSLLKNLAIFNALSKNLTES